MHLRKALVASALAGCLSGSICFAQKTAAELRFSQNATHEVTVTANGEVPRCGVTALPEGPTSKLSGHVIEVMQPVAGIACRADVPQGALRPYRVSINLGRLPPGDYTVNWSFPKLTAAYTVSP